MIYYHSHGLMWRPSSCEKAEQLTSHLETVLRSWRDTPYMAGQQAKGVGVDCVRFVTAVLDELLGLSRTETPRLPPDRAMHDRKGAIATMRLIRRLYPPVETIRDKVVEPGDILIVGQSTGGPGHVILVGVRPNTLWQAGSLGVHEGGLGLIEGAQRVFRVYRFRWDSLL